MRVTPEQYARALLALSGTADVKRIAAAVDAVADELAAAGRSAWLPRVLAAFERLSHEREGGMHATVETPEPLTAAQRKELAERLGVSADKLRIEERLDPSLLAGMRVTVGDRTVAQTVRDRVTRLFAR